MRRDAAAFLALYAAIAIGFFLLNGHNGYHPTDDGFVLAYAWRIVNGEVPYRDFLYVRTPLTPYLHAVWLALPQGWAIPAGRLAFYLELAATGALPTLWAVARHGLRATPRSLALAAVTLLFAAHNFPPMPWPTVDALLFASAALTAFLFSLDGSPRANRTWRAASSLLLALAVLAKQSFAPLAALLLLYAIVAAIRARRWGGIVASLAPGAAMAGTVLALLATSGALVPFLQQIGEPSQLRPSIDTPWSGEFWYVAVDPFLRALGPITVPFMASGFALVWWRDVEGPRAALLRKAASVGVFAAVAALGIELQTDVYDAGRQYFWMLLAVLAAYALHALRGRADRLALVSLFAVLVLGWCASLSFAYQTPLLGLAATAPFLEPAFPRARWPSEALAVALATAVAASSVLLLDLEKPYRELPREAQVADLGEVYPRFGHLYSNADNFARFTELRDLSTRFALGAGRVFVVMPDYPLIYYLAGERSPLSIDWLQPQEYLGNEALLRDELASRAPVVLVAREPSLTSGPSREPPIACDRPRADASRLASEVMTRWVLLAEGRHFCLYRSPG